jgi:hypothetical protein
MHVRDWLRRFIGYSLVERSTGMAESKSNWFALFINAHSEKLRKFDLNSLNRLAEISEWHGENRAPHSAEAVSAKLNGLR